MMPDVSFFVQQHCQEIFHRSKIPPNRTRLLQASLLTFKDGAGHIVFFKSL
jgi:hypothetical protein